MCFFVFLLILFFVDFHSWLRFVVNQSLESIFTIHDDDFSFQNMYNCFLVMTMNSFEKLFKLHQPVFLAHLPCELNFC